MTATLGQRVAAVFEAALHSRLTGHHAPIEPAPQRDWDDWHYADARAPWEDEH